MVTIANGSVTVAPHVLLRLITLAILEVPGVARLGSVPRTQLSRRGTSSSTGVSIHQTAAGVCADCYIIAANTNLVELGTAVQATVAAVIRDLAGMSVAEVNVYIQDVEANSG
jgi:uncharacterized alkaline shock family protein YloU